MQAPSEFPRCFNLTPCCVVNLQMMLRQTARKSRLQSVAFGHLVIIKIARNYVQIQAGSGAEELFQTDAGRVLSLMKRRLQTRSIKGDHADRRFAQDIA